MSVLDIISVVDEFIQGGHQFTCFDVTRQVRARGENVKHSTTRNLVHGLNGDNLPPFRGSGYSRNTVSFTTKNGHTDTAEVYRLDSDVSSYDPDRVGDNSDDSTDSTVQTVQVDPPKPAPAPKPVPKPLSKLTLADMTYPCPHCFNTGCRYELRRSKKGKGHVTLYHTDPRDTGGPAVTPVSNQLSGGFKVDSRGRICVRNDLIRSLGLKRGERVFLQKNGGNSFAITKDRPADNVFIGSLKVDKDENVRVSRAKQQKAGISAVQFTMTKSGDRLVISA